MAGRISTFRIRLPRLQASQCNACGREIIERVNKRVPCRTCGSINRVVSVVANDGMANEDHT